MDWQHFLLRANDVLTAGVSATAFALVLYLTVYNQRSKIARTFCGLLGCVIVVYLMDILLTNNMRPAQVNVLLRIQWIGIAFTPPFYVEFVRTLRSLVSRANFPRWMQPMTLSLSTIITVLAITTNLVVRESRVSAGVVHMQPGPLFYPFAAFFIVITLWGFKETLTARQQCYTRSARRRMAYLSISFVAPALGVFPYLLVSGWPSILPDYVLPILLVFSNIAVASMLILMAYSVAFFDALSPHRVIKHRMVRFLLRGPMTAILALVIFGFGLTAESVLGMGQYTLSLVAIAVAIIITQLGVELFKPLIDLALYRDGAAEVAQVQELSQRLLTTADLKQFLENVLAAMCEQLLSSGGFLAILDEGKLRWEVWCDLHMSEEEKADIPLNQVLNINQNSIMEWDGYWVLPIHDKNGQQLLAIAGVRRPKAPTPFTEDQHERLNQLLLQASAALVDQQLQQVVLGAFSPLLPELTDIQRRGGLLRYSDDDVTGFSLAESEELPQWVHDALAHYWGGPRLTENPLLELAVVKRAAQNYDGNVVKGLRAVLSTAIEKLRPDGERKLTAPEWLLYNILEMKFLRGEKVRQVAMRLAVSESDFYRKQRIAIENLANILVEMEEEAHN
ncbi:MAG: histidine kinase N-terminal 7TM domain-containing protein [Anaerolineae bacterium]|nr:histidine kinase N-terminal 7TM domain-containing protein [Anaerolineae bacterium]